MECHIAVIRALIFPAVTGMKVQQNSQKVPVPGQTCAVKGESRIALDQHGGPDSKGDTHECKYPVPQPMGVTPWYNADLAFCCNPTAMGSVSSRTFDSSTRLTAL